MADQSNFSRFPKKQLVFISSKIVDDGFDWQSLDNNYENEYDECEKILENASSYFNESVVEEDVQFFAKFLEINDDLLSQIFETNDKTLTEQLIIPEAKDYLVEYTVSGSCTFEEEYDTTFSSYDEKWVMGSLDIQRNNGSWDFYSGHLKDTNYDNWEMNDWNVENVKLISNEVQESRNPRKLLENTEKLIPKLDKETLISLKFLIDKQLRGL
jgi:hypothetical protein